MFDLEKIIKKTEDLVNKSELISDSFYALYSLINSVYIPSLNKFYNDSLLEEIDSELEILIKKLKYIENKLENLDLHDMKSHAKLLELRNNMDQFKVEIIKSMHKGDFLINNIINQSKIEESYEKKHLK